MASPANDTTPATKAPERAPSKTPVPTEVGEVTVGTGGELHQAPQDGLVMTTAQGVPMSDDQNSLKAGDRGPTLLEDFALREKIFHFDHERIPERVVHARGYGAHGVFECTDAITDVTCASLFSKVGKQTEVFVRFSTVAGNLGSFDLARDVRGFATKFYTDEGNWDLVGNNIPVFFIQDAIKFPDLVHAVKEEQDRGWPQAQSAHDTFWDFVSVMPEAIHMTQWQMSDRAIPRSFRFMQGFGVHTFRFVDAQGKSTYVKFHWTPVQGLQSVIWNEAVKINGADPDFHRRDLWDAIQGGDYPQWDLGVQLFDDEMADSFDFDILDATKIIPEELVPLRTIGRMTLNRVVDNVFDETEQVAFCTQNVVRGIDFTNDPLLQGRNFSYLDTQLKRLGSPNFTQIPINAPRCPVANFQRDGHMQMAQHKGTGNYEPNTFAGENRGSRASVEQGYQTVARQVSGPTRRVRAESFADHYTQARQFFLSQSEVEQRHIIDGYTFELGKVVSPDIRTRVLASLRNVDEQMAATIADGLGMELPEAATPAAPVRDTQPSPALSMMSRPPASFAGRKIGLLVSDGADADLVKAVQQTANAAGVVVSVVAPKVGGATLSDGSKLEADDAIAGAPSVLFDSVVLAPGEQSVAELAKNPATKDFVNDAFNHYKFIGHAATAAPLFEEVGVEPDAGFVSIAGADDVTTFLQECTKLRNWDRTVFTL